MNKEEIDIAFRKAVERINAYTDPFPADVLLRLYAYYKRATHDSHSPRSDNPLINAFKLNALFQTRDITPEEAKILYIENVEAYFKSKEQKKAK
ncbi:MAG: acyl-CoA-binding protein [Bacteroidetes bacterium]|jgi:acyl-CoA-binding protein|nr:acyl-CoA-binding protein [Bacteroidota bacterium]